jgi:uncharacterized protein (TIGR02646 family)
VIPAVRRPAPASFHLRVGKKGAGVLSKHKPRPPVAGKFWQCKEHWRLALDDLCESYERVCAFASIRIERVTGSPSVEHFKPKSKYPSLAYDWSNYRLVCGLMNGRKGDHEDILDPFEIPIDTFDLNPLSGELLIHRDCPANLRAKAKTTIDRLDRPDCHRVRLDHIDKILRPDWSLQEARRQSPFVLGCLQRQGLL